MEVKQCELRKALSCDEKDSVLEVAKKLKKNEERHIVVVSSGKPVGLISTTDMNNRVVAENKDAKKTKAKQIMTSPIMVKDVSDSLGRVYFDMLKSNVFSIPIVSKGKLKGVLDLKEAMNQLIRAKFQK